MRVTILMRAAQRDKERARLHLSRVKNDVRNHDIRWASHIAGKSLEDRLERFHSGFMDDAGRRQRAERFRLQFQIGSRMLEDAREKRRRLGASPIIVLGFIQKDANHEPRVFYWCKAAEGRQIMGIRILMRQGIDFLRRAGFPGDGKAHHLRRLARSFIDDSLQDHFHHGHRLLRNDAANGRRCAPIRDTGRFRPPRLCTSAAPKASRHWR